MQMAELADIAYFKVSLAVLGCIMPWFFFKSGLFFKQRPTRALVVKEAKKLLIPFIIYSAIGHICQMVILFQQGETNIIHYTLSPVKQLLLDGHITGNMPLWFLGSLFAAKVLFNAIHSIGRNWAIATVTLLIASIPFLLHFFEPACRWPLYIANISAGLFFYACGVYLKPWIGKWYIVLPCIAIYLVSLFVVPTYIDMRANSLDFGNFYLWYPLSLVAIVTFKALCSIIKLPTSFLAGENAMIILCTHWIILLLVRICAPHLSGWDFVAVSGGAIIVTIPVLVALSKRFNIIKF
jgi:hypothetical protein